MDGVLGIIVAAALTALGGLVAARWTFKLGRRTVATQEAQEEREAETSQIANAITVGKEWAAIAADRQRDRERLEAALAQVNERMDLLEEKFKRLESLHNIALNFIRRHVSWVSDALEAGHIHEDAGKPPRVPDELAHVIPDRRRT